MATGTANITALYEDIVADLIPLVIRGLNR
jgi:hypothetical protein